MCWPEAFPWRFSFPSQKPLRVISPGVSEQYLYFSGKEQGLAPNSIIRSAFDPRPIWVPALVRSFPPYTGPTQEDQEKQLEAQGKSQLLLRLYWRVPCFSPHPTAALFSRGSCRGPTGEGVTVHRYRTPAVGKALF